MVNSSDEDLDRLKAEHEPARRIEVAELSTNTKDDVFGVNIHAQQTQHAVHGTPVTNHGHDEFDDARHPTSESGQKRESSSRAQWEADA